MTESRTFDEIVQQSMKETETSLNAFLRSQLIDSRQRKEMQLALDYAQRRYQTDPEFHALVDTVLNVLNDRTDEAVIKAFEIVIRLEQLTGWSTSSQRE